MSANGFTVDVTDNRIWPMGAVLKTGGAHFAADLKGEECSLLLWQRGELAARIPFPKANKLGTIRHMGMKGAGLSKLEYSYEVDGKEVSDIFGASFTGGEKFGELAHVESPRRSRIYDGRFDWEDDKRPGIPYEECIFYRIHPRGFTMHGSSGVKERGTFAGVAKKIPYLKKLGITSVELMLPTEFEEVVMPKEETMFTRYVKQSGPESGETVKPNGKINYWGYGPSYLFAPKAGYCQGRVKNPVNEFKQLVKEFHANGMELLIELYAVADTPAALFEDCLRFWVSEYHVDGFHFTGEVPQAMAAGDPVLQGTKLLAMGWDGVPIVKPSYGDAGTWKNLAEYNDGFMLDMRKFLKGDENQINSAIFHIKRNPKGCGTINYMANTNGFSLQDMVSYERKHNEANGEDNKDGSDCNCTWNCGAEGKTRKKIVQRLRKRQLKNAAAMLFLSQGTPLLQAGDEFGQTKGGNNNSYCQDNEVNWLNWNGVKTNREFYEFVRFIIAFRKKHPIFHMSEEMRMMDYKAYGCPDLSFHGVKAWCPDFESYRRQLGILYCGAYAEAETGKADDDFYVAYNMHWEPQEFGLPNITKGKSWRLAIDTSSEENNGCCYYEEGKEPLLEDQKHITVGPRTIVVIIGRIEPEKGKKKPGGTKKKDAGTS